MPYMFENPRRGRQARNFRTNVPKILDLKSSSKQIFSKIDVGCPWCHCGCRKSACPHCLENRFLHHCNLMDHFTVVAWWTDFVGLFALFCTCLHWWPLFQGVCSGIVRGAGRQRIGVLINFLSFFVALSLGITLMFFVFHESAGKKDMFME